jgi:hypothetical protein
MISVIINPLCNRTRLTPTNDLPFGISRVRVGAGTARIHDLLKSYFWIVTSNSQVCKIAISIPASQKPSRTIYILCLVSSDRSVMGEVISVLDLLNNQVLMPS